MDPLFYTKLKKKKKKISRRLNMQTKESKVTLWALTLTCNQEYLYRRGLKKEKKKKG